MQHFMVCFLSGMGSTVWEHQGCQQHSHHLCSLVLMFSWKGSAYLPHRLQHNFTCHQTWERKLRAGASVLMILCSSSYLYHDLEKEKQKSQKDTIFCKLQTTIFQAGMYSRANLTLIQHLANRSSSTTLVADRQQSQKQTTGIYELDGENT